MTDCAPCNRWIQVAGGVTLVFGLLTAAVPAAWMILLLVIHDADQAPPLAERSLILLMGIGFVLLGWGILRRMRFCAAIAGVLASISLGIQLLAAMSGGLANVSAFFLLLSSFVLLANWLAWKQMGQSTAVQAFEKS